MNGWRYQAPAHSPISAGALLAGLAGAARNGKGVAESEARVLKLLEQRFAARAVLLTTSGTTALTAALLGILEDEPGRVVALPAYACYDLASAADGAKARVFLYDVDPRTLAPDLAQLQSVLRNGVAAVVVVHPYGYPLDLSEVKRLAAQTGAVVIEDAAQAAGATFAGRVAGTQSSLGVLSFGRGKGLTGGSGGALLAYDDAGTRVVERVRRSLAAPRRGWTDLFTLTAQLVFDRPGLYSIPATLPFLHLGETVYRTPQPLRRPSNVSGRVVAATWHLAEREVETRRDNAARLLAALRWQPGFETISPASGAEPGYLRLPVLTSPAVRPFANKPAARRLGVMPGYPLALCDLENFATRCLNRDGAFPGSRLLAARLCTLPTHGRLRIRDLERLEQWIGAAGRG